MTTLLNNHDLDSLISDLSSDTSRSSSNETDRFYDAVSLEFDFPSFPAWPPFAQMSLPFESLHQESLLALTGFSYPLSAQDSPCASPHLLSSVFETAVPVSSKTPSSSKALSRKVASSRRRTRPKRMFKMKQTPITLASLRRLARTIALRI
ncbi:hypothetical protein BC828DRAFT_394754, partial [Blastocladiella britannica]